MHGAKKHNPDAYANTAIASPYVMAYTPGLPAPLFTPIGTGGFYWYEEPHPMPNVPLKIRAIAEVSPSITPHNHAHECIT